MGAASRPTSPVPNTPADVAIEIDEDPPDAADSEPLVCQRTILIFFTALILHFNRGIFLAAWQCFDT